mgnify:FL=1
MKIKVLMALAVLPLMAFECCDDFDTWSGRCQQGSEFTLYPQDVLDEVIGESLMSLNFVQSVIDSHDGNPSLGMHTVKDKTGWVYQVENRIEKSDTIWSDARRRMRIRRSQPGNKWIVTRKDDYGYNDQKYSFELKAERCDKDVDGALKYPWLVTVEGSRSEDSDYSMTYSVSAQMKVRWGNMLTFSSEDIMPEGKLLVSFYKEGKKTDWITACYGTDGTSYETSLNK